MEKCECCASTKRIKAQIRVKKPADGKREREKKKDGAKAPTFCVNVCVVARLLVHIRWSFCASVGFTSKVVTFLHVEYTYFKYKWYNKYNKCNKITTKNHRNLLRPHRNQFAITQNKVVDLMLFFVCSRCFSLHHFYRSSFIFNFF